MDAADAYGERFRRVLARAFKRLVGQTPSELRRTPDWGACSTAFEPLSSSRRSLMKTAHRPEDVTLVSFPEVRVGVLEHHGDHARLGDTIRRFIEWRKANKLHPSVSATYNLLYGNPDQVPPPELRLDLCAEVKGPVLPNDQGVVERILPAGRCAKLRHVGSSDTLEATFDFLYKTWLPESGEELRDFPLFLHRVKFFPDVPAHEEVIDVFLPLRARSA